jgi:hypothetical protein
VLGRSLVQRSRSECGVPQCDRKASIVWRASTLGRPWPARGCRTRAGVGGINYREARDPTSLRH